MRSFMVQEMFGLLNLISWQWLYRPLLLFPSTPTYWLFPSGDFLWKQDMLHFALNIWSRTSQWICSPTVYNWFISNDWTQISCSGPLVNSGNDAIINRLNNPTNNKRQSLVSTETKSTKAIIRNRERNETKSEKAAGIESMVQIVTRGMTNPETGTSYYTSQNISVIEWLSWWVTGIQADQMVGNLLWPRKVSSTTVDTRKNKQKYVAFLFFLCRVLSSC